MNATQSMALDVHLAFSLKNVPDVQHGEQDLLALAQS